MDYSVEKFLGYLNRHEGPSFKNRYHVEISFPPGISADLEGLDLICISASMPGHRISTADRVDLKQTVKVPYTFEIEEAEFVFILDGEYKAYTAFDAWTEKIIDSKTHSVSYKKDIVANKWTIWQLDKNNKKTSGTMLYNVFLTSIGKVDFANEANDTVQTLPITVTYDWRQATE